MTQTASTLNGLGWGIWSTGNIASTFAADLDHVPGARRAAVCSRRQQAADAFANKHGFAAAYDDLRAFLADPAVECVYIASPHPLHRSQALKAISAGKHVLIEKPVAMTATEALAIQAAALDKGVFAMEAMWTRFLPGTQRAKALIEDGAIGNVTQAEADLTLHRPFDPQHRLFNPALGGGALHDLGVYPISVTSFLLGSPELEKAHWIAGATGVDVEVNLAMRFGDVPATIETRFVEEADQEGSNSVVIYGDAGALRIDAPFHTAPSLTIWDTPLDRSGAMDAGTRHDFARAAHGLNFQAIAVQQAIEKGWTSHPAHPLSHSADVLSIIDQVLAQPAAGQRD